MKDEDLIKEWFERRHESSVAIYKKKTYYRNILYKYLYLLFPKLFTAETRYRID